ncbi:hypothetical protein MM236_11215 [Belliella sp. DSM 107340]|uniref:Outer membrane protein beta-barrel domain-containing protein n=1 Tax=Belliella calami TaxID=2923436 RepID=A0ABS9UQ60_9BACT|nr:hypothetical protein [Belliella calami]MCH7398565.1 hypothetical protein [Belliella calami]
MSKFTLLMLLFMFLIFDLAKAQNEKLNMSLAEGVLIVGYVDEGAYLNFTGPNVSYEINQSRLALGMLPSLRFKKDTSTPRNSFVTPNLGVGLTYSYKNLAMQIPFYYNSKTSTQNGKWNIGFGIGLKLDK